MLKSFGNLTYQLWEQLFSERLSWRIRFIYSSAIAFTALAINWLLYRQSGHYFSFLVILAVFAISLFARETLALIYATLLSLACDYFFIPPIGSIFDSQKSIEHFMIIFVTSVMTAVFAGTLRSAFNRLSHAKKAADLASNEAKHATERMEKILALVSHDVRNPLATSRMAVQLLLESPNRVDRQSFMAMISRNLDRADQLIQSLLDVASIRSSGRSISMKYQYCDLSSQISYLVDEMSLTNQNRLIFHPAGPVWGNWGTDGIKRAMENLVSNALKYGDPACPVTIRTERKENRACLSVHNEGNEIDPADQNRLFDFFQRGSHNDDQTTQGWGIGLAVVKAVAESHGGSVAVESGNGLGTKFIIDIPSHIELKRENVEHALV
jgi:signal transduction histidine kinase